MANKPFSNLEKGGKSSGSISSYYDAVSSALGMPSDIRNRLKTVETKVSATKFDRVKHKDTKRSQIAMIFVVGFILVIALVIIGVPIYNALVLESPEPLDIERLLAQVGALIGTPLGFVIGYYFKEDR